MIWIIWAITVFLILVCFWQLSLLLSSIFWAPTVYANDRAIIDSLKLAGLKKGETLIDLGCGNAKSLIIASKQFGAKGVGNEISLYCFLKSKFNVFINGQNRNIRIIFGGFPKVEKELEKANVVYLYLLNKTLKEIEPWFFKHISREARVVVLSFQFPKHQPVAEAPTQNLGRDTKIRLYKL